MYNRKKIFDSNHNEINSWAKLYTESLTEKELSESTSDDDILNTAFSTLLYFLCGEGNTVLKDDEWVNYLVNDINTAIQKGMFKPSFSDKQHIKKLQDIRLGEELDEDVETDVDEK